VQIARKHGRISLQGENMSTPFEETEKRTQQFAAKMLLYRHVNLMVARDEFLAEQFEEDRGTDRWESLKASLQERSQINQSFLMAGAMVEDIDGVNA